MYLNQIDLTNFKNFELLNAQFSDKINCFVGDNGMGKTNLMDAIYYLSFCKSYFNHNDSENIRHQSPFFAIHGTYIDQDETQTTISCLQERGKKKRFKKNKKEYERFSDHVGLVPLVMISPSDQQILTGGSAIRRKFIDGAISQFDREYLVSLLHYTKAVDQRNRVLKDFHKTRSFDTLQLSIWDEQLIRIGTELFKKRIAFLDEFLPLLREYFALITNNQEEIDIIYQSRLHESDFEILLQEYLQRDLALQHSSVGVHRDDLIFLIKSLSAQKFASQGQQKSLVLALRLAQFEHIAKIKKSKPLLILDDIFDKLDMNRVQKLIQLVGSDRFGQVFLTDTQQGRVEEIFQQTDIAHKIFNVNNGYLSEIRKA